MMRKIKLLLFLSLLYFNSSAQKKIEIPDHRADSLFFNSIQKKLNNFNLADLTTSEDSLRIRIWMNQQILEVNQQYGIRAKLITYISTGENKMVMRTLFFDSQISIALLKSFHSNSIQTLPDDTISGLDGFNYIFEIASPKDYRIYSYSLPKPDSEHSIKVVNIINSIEQILDLKTYHQTFINSLDPGNYRWGMESLHVDHFPPDSVKKTSLYNDVKKLLNKKLKVTEQTAHQKFPLILVGGKNYNLRKLCDINEDAVKKVTVLAGNDPKSSLYGEKGIYGVILIELNEPELIEN